MSDTKVTQVEFKGKASEYFGIWIVNLLLSLLTLGIYSAWAKVRRKKYFYNNTLIEKVGFDYHAKPIAILKGRIIAFILFMAYAFGGELNIFIPMLALAVFFLALPWIVISSSRFNARNTSHRGLRFDFIGKVGEAIRVFIVLPIATFFTLYLAWPYADQQRNLFMVKSHQFGLSAFDLKVKASSFYKIYAVFLIIPILIGILAAIAIPAYQSYMNKAEEAAAKIGAISMPLAVGFVAVESNQRVVLAANEADTEPYRVQRVYSVDEENANDLGNDEALEVAGDDALNDAAASATSKAKTFEEAYAESKRQQELERGKMIQNMLNNPTRALYGVVFVLVYLVFVFAFVAYFKSRIGNLVWNKASVDNLSFKSTLRARDYLWIYTTNIIAIAITFGLATPWAQIRLARYRAAKLQIIGDVDFDQFIGNKKQEVKATGEEIGEFFDMDISFG